MISLYLTERELEAIWSACSERLHDISLGLAWRNEDPALVAALKRATKQAERLLPGYATT